MFRVSFFFFFFCDGGGGGGVFNHCCSHARRTLTKKPQAVQGKAFTLIGCGVAHAHMKEQRVVFR